MLKLLHVSCAYLTGAGFLLRAILVLRGSELAAHRVVKTLPHLIDTILLASAIGLLVSWSINPGEHAWLMAKIGALLLYIGFGMLMLRWGRTTARRWIGFVGATLCYGFIVVTAHLKQPFWLW